MRFLEIILMALALSLDASAVALAASSAGRLRGKRAAFRLSFHFGLFQFLMPVAGWSLGLGIERYIAAFDPWIAFALLALVGLRMMRAGASPHSDGESSDPSRGITLVMLSVATSMDALAVGLSLAMLRIAAWYPGIVIGAVTAGMTVLAVSLGHRLGSALGRRAQFAGGAVLVLIGVKIVVGHLGG